MRLHPSHAAMAGAMLLALAAPCLIHPQSANESSQREIPVRQSTCLISADVRRRRKHRWGLEGIGQLPRFLTENALGKDLLVSKAFVGRECPNCAMHKATAYYA
jgi:hypothetical protein